MKASGARHRFDEFAEKFHCPKCHAHGGTAHEALIPAGPLNLMIPTAGSRFLAVSCRLCGYTEFYNMAIAVPAREEESVGSTEPVADTPTPSV